MQSLQTLTRRESQILKLVADSKSNAEIGDTLGISPRTVEKHVEHILKKLGAKNRTAAVMVVWKSKQKAST